MFVGQYMCLEVRASSPTDLSEQNDLRPFLGGTHLHNSVQPLLLQFALSLQVQRFAAATLWRL